MTYTFPGEKEAVQPDSAGVNSSGEFSRTFTRTQGVYQAYRTSDTSHQCWTHPTSHTAGLPLLHQLLNSPLVLRVSQAGGDTVASASLNFGELAQGLSELSETALQLTSAAGQVELAPNAVLKVQVSPYTPTNCESESR